VMGYHVYRSASPDGPYTRLNATVVTGTSFTDTSAPSGTQCYMVRAVIQQSGPSGSYANLSQGVFSFASSSGVTPVSAQTAVTPVKNFLNPTKGETARFRVSFSEAGHLKAGIYDRRGSKIASLIDTDVSAGTTQVSWDGKNNQGSLVASGVYLLLFDASGTQSVSKVVVAK
jgi:hypothetical protein